MFEQELEDKFKRIFDLKKCSFDLPSETHEQECLFVNIESSNNHFRDGRAVGKVTGSISVYANPDKLPYGYFSKKIVEAKPEDTKDLYFYDIEKNTQTMSGISERKMSFIYLYDMQYNPNIGELTSLETVATVGNEQ